MPKALLDFMGYCIYLGFPIMKNVKDLYFGQKGFNDMIYTLIIISLLMLTIVFRLIYEYIIGNNIFECSNCGHNFKKDWIQLIFSSLKRKGILNWWKKEYLECPECKVKDFCKIK